MMRALCIVPVFNQERDLPALLERLKKTQHSDSVLLVDDGSTDGSSVIIRQSGFPFIRVERRRGIGHALIVGTRYARSQGFQIIVHLAGNGKMRPEEMDRVLTPIRNGEADYVWGSRFLPGGNFENAPRFRRWAIPAVFNRIPQIFTGKKVTDATCGYRAYRLSLLDECATGWDSPWLYKYEFEYYVMAKVLRSGFRFREVPISMVYPASKRSYSKIVPVISWWSMLKPWLVVALGWDAKIGAHTESAVVEASLAARE